MASNAPIIARSLQLTVNSFSGTVLNRSRQPLESFRPSDGSQEYRNLASLKRTGEENWRTMVLEIFISTCQVGGDFSCERASERASDNLTEERCVYRNESGGQINENGGESIESWVETRVPAINHGSR